MRTATEKVADAGGEVPDETAAEDGLGGDDPMVCGDRPCIRSGSILPVILSVGRSRALQGNSAAQAFVKSKFLSGRQVKVDLLPLSVRSWTCAGCGAEHDRDMNAAINLTSGVSLWSGGLWQRD